MAAVGDLVMNLLANTKQFTASVNASIKQLHALSQAAASVSSAGGQGVADLSSKQAASLLGTLEKTAGPAKFLGLESEKTAKHVQSAAKHAHAMHVNILDIVKGMLLMRGIMTVFAGFGAMIRGAFDFEKEMRNSQAIMSDLSETLDKKMRAAVVETALTTKYSMAEAAKGLFYLASAGLDAEQSILALPVAARFAMAGNMDFARAAEVLSDAQAAMGLKVKDAMQNQINMAYVADVLAAANVKSQGTVEQFGVALTKAAPMARAFHRTLEETTAALMVLHDKGVKAEEAGTDLSIVYRELADLGIKVPDQLKKLNVTIFEAGKMRPLADMVGDLEKAFAKLTDEEIKLQLASMKVEDRATRFLLTLLGSSDKLRQFGKELNTVGGFAETVAGRQLDKIQTSLHQLTVKATEAGVELRTTFGPAIVWIADTMARFSSGLPETVKLIVKYGAAWLTFSVATKVVGAAITIVTKITKAWTTATQLQAKAQAVLMALGGKKAMAQLIIGMALAAGTVVTLNWAFEKMEQSSRAAAAEGYEASKALGDLERIGGAPAAASPILDLSIAAHELKKNLESLPKGSESLGQGIASSFDAARLATTLLASQTEAMYAAPWKSGKWLGSMELYSAGVRDIQASLVNLATANGGVIGKMAEESANAFARVAAARDRLAAVVQETESLGPKAWTPERFAAVRKAYEEFTAAVKGSLAVMGALKEQFGGKFAAFAQPQLQLLGAGAADPAAELQENIKAAMSYAQQAVKQIETPMAILERTKARIASLGELFPKTFTAEAQASLMKKAMDDFDQSLGGPVKHIAELEQNIRHMTSGMTKGQIAAEKFAENPFVTPEQLAQIERLTNKQEEIKKAQLVREKIETSAEKFAKQRQEIQDLLAKQQITEPEATRALAVIDREEKGGEEDKRAGAMRAGSSEAWSTILASMKPGKQAEEETAANTRHLEKLRDMKEALDKLAYRAEKDREIIANF